MRYYDRFLNFCGSVAGFLILLITVGIGVDVALRGIQGQGVYWLIDVVEYALLAVTFLGAPWVLRYGGHVSVDIAVMALPSRVRAVVRRVVCALGGAICGMTALIGVWTAYEAWQRETLIFKSLVFPEWWVLVVIPFSMGLCTFEFLRQVVAGAPEPNSMPGGVE